MVEAKRAPQVVGKESEAAGHQHRSDAGLAQATHQGLGTGVEPKALFLDPLQGALVEAGEQGHPAAQTLGEFQFAAHRGLGDVGDLAADAVEVGQFVDALDVDQRRVHVGDEQPEIAQAPALRHPGEVEFAFGAVVGHVVAIAGAEQAEGAAADSLDAGGRGHAGQFLQGAGRDVVSLDDQMHRCRSGL